MYGWVAAVTQKPSRVNEELDTDALHGKRCRVYLTVKELDGGGSINQVEKVLPLDMDVDHHDVAGEEDDDRPPL
jgi:hypothetical protein